VAPLNTHPKCRSAILRSHSWRSQTLPLLVFATCFGLINPGNIAIADKLDTKSDGMSLPAKFRPFHAASPWNTPIPSNPEIDPASPAMIQRLALTAKTLKFDSKQWTIPLFVVDAVPGPRVTVSFTKTANPLIDPEKKGFVEGLPIPVNAWPDPKPDGHMLIIDPKLMISWDFSRVQKLPNGHWKASRIDVWDLKGMGVRKPFTGKTWWSYGARGSGMPLIAGLIRPEEIEAGVIHHALVFAAPTNRKSTVSGGPKELCSPASRTDGSNSGPDTLPMGVRLQLDPSFDLSSIRLTKEVMVIAKAMQKYGMYNGDSTHNTFKIYLQNLGEDGGKWSNMDLSSLSLIPIEHFRALKCDLVSKS
jgi:hypothetical protein